MNVLLIDDEPHTITSELALVEEIGFSKTFIETASEFVTAVEQLRAEGPAELNNESVDRKSTYPLPDIVVIDKQFDKRKIDAFEASATSNIFVGRFGADYLNHPEFKASILGLILWDCVLDQFPEARKIPAIILSNWRDDPDALEILEKWEREGFFVRWVRKSKTEDEPLDQKNSEFETALHEAVEFIDNVREVEASFPTAETRELSRNPNLPQMRQLAQIDKDDGAMAGSNPLMFQAGNQMIDPTTITKEITAAIYAANVDPFDFFDALGRAGINDVNELASLSPIKLEGFAPSLVASGATKQIIAAAKAATFDQAAEDGDGAKDVSGGKPISPVALLRGSISSQMLLFAQQEVAEMGALQNVGSGEKESSAGHIWTPDRDEYQKEMARTIIKVVILTAIYFGKAMVLVDHSGEFAFVFRKLLFAQVPVNDAKRKAFLDDLRHALVQASRQSPLTNGEFTLRYDQGALLLEIENVEFEEKTEFRNVDTKEFFGDG